MTDWLTWDGGSLTADVITATSEEQSWEITSAPIETGSSVSDHAIKNPARMTWEFAQSEQPFADDDVKWVQGTLDVRESLFEPGGLLWAQMQVGAAIDAVGSALGFGGSGGKPKYWHLTAKTKDVDRIAKIRDALLDVAEKQKELTLEFKGIRYTGYHVVAFKHTRTNQEAGLSRFTLDVQKVTTVKTGASGLMDDFAAGANLVKSVAAAVGAGGKDTAKEIETRVRDRTLLDMGAEWSGLL